MNVTWHDTPSPPTFAHGLPSEIHFWKCQGNIFVLRDTDDPTIPTWCMWRPGQALKDVGAEYVTTAGRRGL